MCFRSLEADITDNRDDYDQMVLEFAEDYQRCNPVTSKQGWKDWLEIFQGKKQAEKKGVQEKEIIEQKLQGIIPTGDATVMQYALEHHEPRKGLQIFTEARRDSVFIPKNDARSSTMFQKVPYEPRESRSSRHFTINQII